MTHSYIFSLLFCLSFTFFSYTADWFKAFLGKKNTTSIQIGSITIPSKISSSKQGNALIHQLICILSDRETQTNDLLEKEEYNTKIRMLIDMTAPLDGRSVIRDPLNAQLKISTKDEVKTSLPSILQDIAAWVQIKELQISALRNVQILEAQLSNVNSFAVQQQMALDQRNEQLHRLEQKNNTSPQQKALAKGPSQNFQSLRLQHNQRQAQQLALTISDNNNQQQEQQNYAGTGLNN